MDATTAMNRSTDIMNRLVGNLTPEHKDMATPCDQWTVHDLMGHVCGGGHMIAGGLVGEAPPEEMPDFLAEGPVNGWAGTVAHMQAAATAENLSAMKQMPFGEVPGEVALSVIVADHVTHAWDLAEATGQDAQIDDELAEWATGVWQQVVPAEGRTGDGFKAVVEIPAGSGAVDQLLAYTGRQP